MTTNGARRTALAASLLSLALAAAPADGAPASGLLKPVFPASAPGLAAYEGERAVSTNMASQPTLNYGCSGTRALQLSRTGRLPGGSPYYAEYCVYADAPGDYELWYGGTPPGPKDELSASFSSPIAVSVDGGPARALWREDVNVVEAYAPAYYWVRTPPIRLEAGAHVIRFEVSERRRLDDRFFFYLDAFFLATPEALARADRAGYPAFFPKKPSDRSIDNPYRSFEEYQALIQANPSAIGPYVELADAYSLAGDYLNALRVLARAALIAPKDERVRLLSAKNRIWRGDVKEGLDAYGIYLSLRPDDLSAYEEAGKVAAWAGRYPDSEYFYNLGLAAFPDELSLLVNLGLTYLWAGRAADADRAFAKALKSASEDPGRAERLAAIYRDNGVPDRAAAAYEKGIELFPDRLGLYLDLSSVLAEEGKDAEARAVEGRITSSFEPSAELDAALADARARRELKADRIAQLEERIAASPDDLGLREELIRVYSWNGRKAEAAAQLESILAARFSRSLQASDEKASALSAARLSAAALRADAEDRTVALESARAKAAAARGSAEKAAAALAAREAAEAAAEAAGKASPGGIDEARAASESALRNLEEAAAALGAETARLALLAERAAAVKEAFDRANQADQSEDAAFKSLSEGQGWTFDPAEAASELALPAARGDALASIARARVLISTSKDKDARAAAAALAAVSSEALSDRVEEAALRLEARRGYRSIYAAARSTGPDEAGARPALAAAARELALVAAADAAPGAGVEEALAAADAAKNAAAEARGLLAGVERDAARADDRRIERAWFAFETEAAELRAELGSDYDAMGKPAQATRQYRRVLAVDRSNLRAMYSLALAEDKEGAWAEAASLLRAVNGTDPYYFNAAALYNGIARRHAAAFTAETIFMVDKNLFDYRAAARAAFPAGSALSVEPRAEVRSIRDRNFGYPAFISALVGLDLPISIVGAGITLRPSGSLIATSSDFSSFGIGTSSPSEFADTISLYSAGGASIDWESGQWKAGLSYSYAPLPDSLNPAIQIDPAFSAMAGLYAHRVELSGSAYLPLGGPFRYLAPRIYASGGYVPKDGRNLYGTGLLEIIPALRLSDSPWANLGFPLVAVLEQSKESRIFPYYAAEDSLTAKGGLLWQSSFAMKSGDSLSISLQGMGGLSQSGTFSSKPSNYLYLYALARADWTHHDSTLYLSIEGSATDPFAVEPLYWSFSLLGGMTARMPDLIAP
jgi:hypothetical protein